MLNTSVSELLDNLRENFLVELPGRISLIEDAILSSSSDSSNDEMFRIVHSFKGSSGSYNFHIISKITHHLEDVMLHLVQTNKLNTEEGIDLLLEYIDLLKLTVSNLLNNKTEHSHVEMLLENLNKKVFKELYQILIIEPSKTYSRLLDDSLKDLPVIINFVTDGLEALEILLVKKYSLLITSMEVSPLNADALIAALRCCHGINKNINCVLITSYKKFQIQNKDMFSSIEEKNVVNKDKLKSIVKFYMNKKVSV